MERRDIEQIEKRLEYYMLVEKLKKPMSLENRELQKRQRQLLLNDAKLLVDEYIKCIDVIAAYRLQELIANIVESV